MPATARHLKRLLGCPCLAVCRLPWFVLPERTDELIDEIAKTCRDSGVTQEPVRAAVRELIVRLDDLLGAIRDRTA